MVQHTASWIRTCLCLGAGSVALQKRSLLLLLLLLLGVVVALGLLPERFLAQEEFRAFLRQARLLLSIDVGMVSMTIVSNREQYSQ